MGYKKVSEHFWENEFQCPCPKCKNKPIEINDNLIKKLELLRSALGNIPIIINSGNRCIEYNKKIGGHPNSPHIPNPKGEAVDTKIIGIKPLNIGLTAEKIGGLRIGIAKSYAHLDIREPSPSRYWIYLKDKIVYSANIENRSLEKFYNKIIKKGDEL